MVVYEPLCEEIPSVKSVQMLQVWVLVKKKKKKQHTSKSLLSLLYLNHVAAN